MCSASGAKTRAARGMKIEPLGPSVAAAGDVVEIPVSVNVGVRSERLTETVMLPGLPTLAPAEDTIPGIAKLIESAKAAIDASATARRRPVLRIDIPQ